MTKMKFDIDYQRICLDVFVLPDGNYCVMQVDTWVVDYL
jgi:predicted RNA-binding protein associated with RNAse of E/G family